MPKRLYFVCVLLAVGKNLQSIDEMIKDLNVLVFMITFSSIH
jgi:hypothetical protein